ncbi:hypothetical protein ACFFUB_12335 [Algimonas porphyrae]|nr:hypothetical protein [Algimonas porphyrae]
MDQIQGRVQNFGTNKGRLAGMQGGFYIKEYTMQRFTERTGLIEKPQQLKLGEIPDGFRNIVHLSMIEALEHVRLYGSMGGYYLSPEGKELFRDFTVIELGKPVAKNMKYEAAERIADSIHLSAFPKLFDYLEYFMERDTSGRCADRIATACVKHAVAYRVRNRHFIAIGNNEQAEAFESAFEITRNSSANGASAHLEQAARALAQQKYADSVRESISAVESTVRFLTGSSGTLGELLSSLKKKKALHPALADSFSKMYGYTSDVDGIRHSLIHEDTASVSEAEALYMIGACSSFISYLLTTEAS